MAIMNLCTRDSPFYSTWSPIPTTALISSPPSALLLLIFVCTLSENGPAQRTFNFTRPQAPPVSNHRLPPMSEDDTALDVPDLGVYLAFKIDPFASLEELHDSQVDAVTKTMQTKTYVGMVSEVRHKSCPSRPPTERHPQLANLLAADSGKGHQAIEVMLLSPYPAVTDDATGFDASFCTPVLPATSHPDGRPPLEANPPLPWPNCYHILDTQTRIRLKRRLQAIPKETPRLPDDEMDRLLDLVDGDGTLFRERKTAMGLNSDAEDDVDDGAEPEVEAVGEGEEDGVEYGGGLPDGELDDQDEGSAEEEPVNEEGAFIMALANGEDESTFPVADFFYEVARLPELSDPREFFQELAALKK